MRKARPDTLQSRAWPGLPGWSGTDLTKESAQESAQDSTKDSAQAAALAPAIAESAAAGPLASGGIHLSGHAKKSCQRRGAWIRETFLGD